MPNRIIRDSCKSSPSLDRLSDRAERLHWRLVTVADDFGRFKSDPTLVLASAFPRKIATWSVDEIPPLLHELEAAGIVRLYEVNGEPFGLFVNWTKHQTTRALKSKFPAPEKPPAEKAERDFEGWFEPFWTEYPRKDGRETALKAWRKLAPTSDLITEILDAVRWQKGSDLHLKREKRFIPLAATWINGKKWTDEKPSGRSDWKPKAMRDAR